MKRTASVCIPIAVLAATTLRAAGNDILLETLDLTKQVSQPPPLGYPAKAARSVSGSPLTLQGTVYQHGVGMHSGSTLLIDLHGEAQSFRALAGLDDANLSYARPLPGSELPKGLLNHPGLATIEIWGDGNRIFDSGLLRRGGKPTTISVDLTGVRRMLLVVTDGGRWPYNNPVDLADAIIQMRPNAAARPETLPLPVEAEPEIGAADNTKPAIHGPRVIGASPGHPFLWAVPAIGPGVLTFRAAGLPTKLKIDGRTGIISGVIEHEGETSVRLTVSSPSGQDTRTVRIVAGNRTLALTPPMGWNSWNVWARAVDGAKIRAAADWMVKTGLAAHGFEYIDIDDAWMGQRDSSGVIQPNEKFQNIKALAAYVHAHGLKLGIYSSPGPKTCQQLEGSYQHEAMDASTYAAWGVDLLKYDLCSYSGLIKNNDREEYERPYRVMGDALRKAPRDIVFSLCEYGKGDVGAWGGEVGAQMWRTTGDIRDSWESMSQIGFGQAGWEKWSGPGRWNDPDMLVLGRLGWGVELHATRLTPNEQLTHITLWSMLAAPLLLGCDLSQLDPFALKLLTDDEVLDVDQDPLGKQAVRKSQNGFVEIWSRPLWDGTTAVALFNRGVQEASISASWSDVGLSGRQPVRDLWKRKDLGQFDRAYQANVPAHGAVLLKIGTPKNDAP